MCFQQLTRWAVLAFVFSLPAASSEAQIVSSVGVGGENREGDVKRIQVLLNSVSDVSGGPKTRLEEDGDIGPRTIAAIKRFQRMQLGFEDGRIDPGARTELRLRRVNGQHVLLGGADTPNERRLAEFASTYLSIVVTVDRKKIAVRPPYHINAGQRKTDAVANRKANHAVGKLITDTLGAGEATIGKATPEQIQEFLQAAVNADLVTNPTPDSLRSFLAEYGVSTDCSGLASRACNLLNPDHPLDVVNKANTAHLATLGAVESPANLKAGDLMVKGGSHVRLITDVDMTPHGIEFTTLESTAGRIFPNGNGIGERRWRFPNDQKFAQLQQWQRGAFVEASQSDEAYLYTSR